VAVQVTGWMNSGTKIVNIQSA